jgi:glycosyltransferase involved in cell wall biosynthesis
MKICFIDFGFYRPEQVLTPLYEYSQILNNKGHSVTVYVRYHKSNIPSDGKLMINSVCKEFFLRKFTHIVFIYKLIHFLKKDKYDIIHVFNFPGVSLLPIFCKNKGSRWILDIQSVTEEAGLKGLLFDNLTVFESTPFDIVNVLNSRMKMKLFKNNLSSKIKIIPLGVNLKRFNQVKGDRSCWESIGISKNDIILVYIGQIDRHRKLENLLDAFKITIRCVKNMNVALVLIGGKADYIQKLNTKAKTDLISDKVFFLGQVSYSTIPDYLKSADIGIAYIPKTDSYNIQPPLKTLEYLAASLAVVATNTDANLDILHDGVNGIIVGDNPIDFAQGLVKIIDRSDLRQYIRNNAYGAVSNYDWEKIVDELLKVYENG